MAPSILLLDDDHFDADAYSEELANEGFFVSIAPSVEAARNTLNAGPFDLVILDVRLPYGDRLFSYQTLELETAQALVQTVGTAFGAPVIVLTNKPEPEVAAWLAEEDSVGYYEKRDVPPFSLPGLIRSLLEQGE